MKKIGLVIDYFQPKLGYIETFLAKEFSRLGYELKVFTSDRYFPFPDYENTSQKILGPRMVGVGDFEEEGISVSRSKCKLELFTRVYCPELPTQIEHYNPDMILLNGCANFSAISVSRLKKKLGIPLVLWDSQHLSILNQQRKIKEIFYFGYRTLFTPKINKAANACFGISPETTDIIADIYGYDRSKIHLIPLGTDTHLFSRQEELRCAMRKKYSIADDDVVFIYTGKLIADKGPHLLTEGYSNLARNLKKRAKLLLVGNGAEDYIDQINKSLSDEEQKNNLIRVNAVPMKELPSFYNMADVGVWPLQESTSMLDAASCELPIIIDGNCGTLDRISDQNGIGYEHGGKGMGESMGFFLNNPEELINYGKRGRILMQKDYSWTSICKKIIGLAQ